jgi:hypothetical protein
MEKDKCTRCDSTNINLVRCWEIDEETGEKIYLDLLDGHCYDCGWDFIIVEL